MTAAQLAEAQKLISEWKVIPNDLAVTLASEFEGWFRSLASKGDLPRVFTGVTKDGKQAMLILSGLPLDRIQMLDFLIWLCRTEQFVTYALATKSGLLDKSNNMIEVIDIIDVAKTLGIEALPNDAYRLFDRSQSVKPANSSDFLFFGLQRSKNAIPNNEQELFRQLWSELRPKSMWRQR
jgi:hypothetical protein